MQNNELMIENENLFRALVFSPLALLFIVFGGQFLSSSGLMLFKIIYVLLALAFTISALAYCAFYANDLNEDDAEGINQNLFSALLCAPLAMAFSFFAINSISISSHVFFTSLYVVLALCFTLAALAYAAYFTNECYEH